MTSFAVLLAHRSRLLGKNLKASIRPPRASFHYLPNLVADSNDENFDIKYIDYFSRTDIDHWALRKGLNDLHATDVIPEPEVICSALRACRRVSDYALAIRFLEAIQFKCGGFKSKIWPYLLQEIRPTLEELGVDTPEALGYDKPELHLKTVYDYD